MLAGIYYGAQYGGSTTAILVNIPGEATSVVTTLDGHQMAKQGRAGVALGIAAIGSFIAGCVATVIIAALAVPLTAMALLFGPADYFSLMVLGAHVRRGAGARLGAEGDRHHPGRHPALHCRHGPGERRGAPHLRLERDRRRPRRRRHCHGHVRVRRDPAQSRDHAGPRRHSWRHRPPAAQCARHEASRRADRARHLHRVAPGPPARQRRRARAVCLLHGREEAGQGPLALRPGRHRGRGGPGSRPTTPARRRPSFRCSRSASRPTR